MPAKLNHTIVAARDRNASALFLSEVLGLDPPVILGPFALVKVGDELTLDFAERAEDIRPPHSGSTGTAAQDPHPLIAEKLEREPTSERSSGESRTPSLNSDLPGENLDMDFDKAMKNPATVFGTPEALCKSTELAPKQKRALLLQWKDQLQQLQAADEEGMQKSGPAAGTTAELLGRVTTVLARIDADSK